ncbi:hypothetical protein [Kribbella sp. NPDC004875]|uniref:hypothetical protein n=1 Tax=Kribbella sp. NPDC004875 TaxID=3364107 RepID=UPI0036765EC5
MSLPVIPAPAQTVPGDGIVTRTASAGIDVGSPELAGVAARFVADVELDTGLALTGDSGITVTSATVWRSRRRASGCGARHPRRSTAV